MRENKILVVHCPEPWQREALCRLCQALDPGVWTFQTTPDYPYQILGHVPGEIHGNDERPAWAAATGAPDPVPFADLTLAQLRAALGLDEPKEAERIELPNLGDWECRIDRGDLVVGCSSLDLDEVDDFIDAYQEARKGQAGGEAKEEAPQEQEVQLSNGLRLRLESQEGNTVDLKASGDGTRWFYVLELSCCSRAARLPRGCQHLRGLMPVDEDGRLKVEDYRTGQQLL